jgi:L-amino acid N-acyltransferase YncA
MENHMIRPAGIGDAESIARIYNHYVLNTVATFEEQTVSVAEMAKRIEDVQSASFPWLVCERANQTVGYAYAGKWHHRSAYRYSTECTVYLDPTVRGQGLATALYEALFAILHKKQMHTVIAVIALPNEASVALHEKFGLQQVAHLKEVGFKFNRRIDVGYWQIVLQAKKWGA